jgi:hypothetical protein
MFNKRKQERETILRDLRIIKKMLREADQKPVPNKVIVQTVTNKPTSGRMYRSAEVALKLGLTVDQFDGLRKKTKIEPALGGGVGRPCSWTKAQIDWFKVYLETGAHKTRNRKSSKRRVQV